MNNTDKNILIIEDEFSIAMDMEMRLQKMGYKVAGIATNYKDALAVLLEKDIDIALLDINLNSDKNGIDIGIIIKEKFNIPIVFITAYTDPKTFDDALVANPMGYITKPFKDADLHNNIQLALIKFSKTLDENPDLKLESQLFFIKDKGVLKQVNIDDITWIEAMDNYTVVHTSSGKNIVNAFLKDVLIKLGNDFVRIHRSHAVSLKKITSIEDNLVYIGKTFLVISQSYRQNLLDRLDII
jgi:DNA-binding LytR/AlgR family response regulator